MLDVTEVILYYFLNLSSEFCLLASSNALYFVLDLKEVVQHFLQHFATFLLVLIPFYIRARPKILANKSLKQFRAPVLTQILITFLSHIVYSQERFGGVHLLRICDLLKTITILKYDRGLKQRSALPSDRILILLAIYATLSWLEFDLLQCSTISLIITPILAVLQGVQVLQIRKCYREAAGSDMLTFMVYFTGLTALCLLIPSLYSWNLSRIPLDSSWESIDSALIGLSFLFMANFKYSQLLLQIHLNPKKYMILEHSKYWLASIGKCILQSMTHVTIFSFLGKLLYPGTLIKYILENKAEAIVG